MINDLEVLGVAWSCCPGTLCVGSLECKPLGRGPGHRDLFCPTTLVVFSFIIVSVTFASSVFPLKF